MNIVGALSSGYTTKQILNYLSAAYPQFGGQIQKALVAGKSVDEIMKFISKLDKKDLGRVKATPLYGRQFPDESNENPLIAASRSIEEHERIPRQVKTAAGIAGGALGAYAIGRALPGAAQALLGTGGATSPTPPAPVPTAPTPSGGAPAIPQAPPAPTAPIPKTPVPVSLPSGWAKKINDMMGSNNTADQIQAYFKHFHPKEVAKIEASLGKPLSEIIGEFTSQGNTNLQPQAPSPEAVESKAALQEQKPAEPLKTESIPRAEEAKKEETVEEIQKRLGVSFFQAQKIRAQQRSSQASKTVALPSGEIGEIQSVKNGIAKVVVNGKEHARRLDELEQEPEIVNSFDYEKMVDEYIKSIPESERSAAMIMNFFVGKNEKKDVGEFFIMRPGDPEHIGFYSNVPKELSDKINAANTAPKTSGRTNLGEWSTERADSRGSPADDLRANPDKYPFTKVEIPHNLLLRWLLANKSLEKKRRHAEAQEKKNKKY